MLLFPHAKINIGLDIVGRLPNGYHLIDTIMVHTDWEDILELTEAERTELVVTGRQINCPPEKNLVMRAYNLMSETVGALPPTRIHLHKIVPDGAGLGGGSADAAYTLRGLNALYSLGLDNEKLARLAAQLGADCPFFIYDEPMSCTGIGTELSPIDLQGRLDSYTLAIVKPPFGVSTAEAYAGVKIEVPAVSLTERIKMPVESWKDRICNAFEASVVTKHPFIEEVKNGLSQLGAVYVSMSGSGSAVYGFFEHCDSEILTRTLADKFPDSAIHVSKKR